MILLTGGSGQLGTALRRLLDTVHAPGRDELDLARPSSLPPAIEALHPSAIVNCAAYTDVDRAEEEEDLATTVNCEAVGVMAAIAAAAGIPFVTFSTDYVFDGTSNAPYVESSPTAPINVYGVSKELGERAALAAHPHPLVIRTSWVAAETHPNFVTGIIERASREAVQVVSDQVGSPTYAADLAAATLEALAAGAGGILHLANSGQASRFEMARVACEAAGIDPGRVEPATSEQFPTKARRPRYSPLASERLDEVGIQPLRPWQEAIADLVARLPGD
ncbi:MAG TPA: dTDP-4-dehydrorhamnose reductase [Acidimicrobiia bacterium]|nr:dTDP-4-dehydrorhamnose reductase [Acidimicrobiia bacterium]